jgi:hypothetical protein
MSNGQSGGPEWLAWATLISGFIASFFGALGAGSRGDHLSGDDLRRVRKVVARVADPDDPCDDPDTHAEKVGRE